jgi:uncharacterized membrane protein YeaQ/YmgE (transglycosylase-associated protein family)
VFLFLVLVAIIVLLIVGGAIFGLALTLLWWALLGLVIGALGRLVAPGRQPIGWLATAAYGIGGALLGGIIGRAIGVGGFVQFLIAIAVAAVLIGVLGSPKRGALT